MTDSKLEGESNLPAKKLHQFSPGEVAEELCLMDAELLRKISSKELENGAWMKKDKKHELSPNIMAMVNLFNQLALIIPTEILAEVTPQARAKVITVFIQVASKCHSHHNYNSLKAVLAGLQCTPIFRLSKTWKEVSSKRRKKFNSLTKLMSEEQNWLFYRNELEPKLNNNSPFIPFLGVFLTDVALSQEAASMSKRRGAKLSLASQKEISKDMSSRRSSTALYETYTILEPITIRNRLEKLRSMTSQDEDIELNPSTSFSTHSDSDKEDTETDNDSFYSCKSGTNSTASSRKSSRQSVASPLDRLVHSPIKISFSSPSTASSPVKLPTIPIEPLTTVTYTYSDSMEEWDVGEWLRKVGLETYTESFIDNGYETIELCANLNGTDMTAIGITNKQHRSTLFKHARMLLECDSCCLGEGGNRRAATKQSPSDQSSTADSESSKPSRPRLATLKGKDSFSHTLSGSLECLMSVIKPGGVVHSETYEHPNVLLKSSSLQSLNSENSSDLVVQSHKRTSSDSPMMSSPANEPAQKSHSSDNLAASSQVNDLVQNSRKRSISHDPGTFSQPEQMHNFSGLPPQLPLHSQSAHNAKAYSPNKEIKLKAEHSPLKETSSKIKSWLQGPLEHHHKGSFLPVKKRNKELTHTASSPVLVNRPRRSSAIVPRLRASQITAKTDATKNPVDVLDTYQFLSLGVVAGVDSNQELRKILNDSSHNTETQNFKISYQLEAN